MTKSGEAEAAKWLVEKELGTVNWLPADMEVVEVIKNKELWH